MNGLILVETIITAYKNEDKDTFNTLINKLIKRGLVVEFLTETIEKHYFDLAIELTLDFTPSDVYIMMNNIVVIGNVDITILMNKYKEYLRYGTDEVIRNKKHRMFVTWINRVVVNQI